MKIQYHEPVRLIAIVQHLWYSYAQFRATENRSFTDRKTFYIDRRGREEEARRERWGKRDREQ